MLFVLGEFFGWPQSGLVVPGYLAGILVIQPMVAAVIAAEAVLTYLLALIAGRILTRFLPISRPFGRDRFFLILLCSVIVRLWVESGPAQELIIAAGLSSVGPLHSLGLVLVPLAANALWMPGLLRGVPLVGLPVLVVFWFLDGVLLPWTNLNLSHFAFTYENLAHDFVSVPRAYVLLLVGTLVAMRFNLRFGWEFGGVLIPGLLAIAWIEPEKVVATFVEVILTVAAMRLLTRIRPLSSVNLSGLRPLVLAFTVAYGLKLVVAAWLGQKYPGLRASDLFGFGYLLPSLIAVRCWQRGQMWRVLLPTALASFGGFVLGSMAGLALEEARPPATEQELHAGLPPELPAWQALTRGALPAHPEDPVDPGIISAVLSAVDKGWPVRSSEVAVDAHPDGWVIRSAANASIGRLWIRKNAATDLLLVAPTAATVPGEAEAATVLAQLLDVGFLALAPSPALLDEATRRASSVIVLGQGKDSHLRAAGGLPDALPLAPLTQVFPDLTTRWDGLEPDSIDLVLSESDRLTAALLKFKAEPQEGRLDLWDETAVRMSSHPPTHTDLATLDRAVLQPLLLARNGDPRWLQLAAAQAAPLKLAVAADDTALSLGPASGRLPPKWTLWLRRDGSSKIIEVPAAGRQHRTSIVGRAWWSATQASALLSHDAGSDLDGGALKRAGLQAPEGVILRRLVLDKPGATVISVDAFRQDEAPGGDAIISMGRPQLTGEVLPEHVNELREMVEQTGARVAIYSGLPNQIRFHGPSNARRKMVELAGGNYLTAYLSPLYRLRFPPLGDSTGLRTVLSNAGLPLRDASIEALLVGEVLSQEETRSRFGLILGDLERYGASNHPGELQKLHRRARVMGAHVEVVVDSEDGTPFLKVDHKGRHLLAPLSRFSGQLASADSGLQDLAQNGQAIGIRRVRK
ncbi:MAG: poly-gamma-glutamate biosynthesis protein PgsC/CapC [Myxococcota bacterium]|nr:poly-gamma-glutamate biosynthesis protein PgsC/CapC [Myxococcota bacterium]